MLSRCRFSHDIPAYLAAKPRDIYFNLSDPLTDTPPFVKLPEAEDNMGVDSTQNSVDFSTHCPNFEETGACRHGFKCRFLGGHVRKEDGKLLLIQDDSKKSNSLRSATEMNYIDGQTMKLLRTKKVGLRSTSSHSNPCGKLIRDSMFRVVSPSNHHCIFEGARRG